jgi:hypothetical protein
MFLYYREQSKFICDIFKSVDSITEFLTTMGVCVWKNLNYTLILLLLFVLISITTNKRRVN